MRHGIKCSIENCTKITETQLQSICRMHKWRIKNTGSPFKTPTGKRIQRKCIDTQCNNLQFAKEYCRKHYKRLALYGRTYKIKFKRDVYTTSSGYNLIYDENNPNAQKDGSVLLHRYIMSKHIGRPLEKSEIVHHINGIRTDNRLENLELRTRKTHPPGHVHVCPNCGHQYT